jgi:decaprenylphospho-beta-D-ribofuranose 2-oxidase
MTIVSNWGKTPKIDANVIPFHSQQQLNEAVANTTSAISRGMGRCYGDSALHSTILQTTEFNQIKSFDEKTGIICCEAGIQLNTILQQIVKKGWFLPVTPGTKYATIGGAVAANVHGKNHHKDGSLSNHLIYIDVLTSDGQLQRASTTENEELFYMTCGGMGLTGVITEVTLQLIPISTAYIRQKTIKAKNLSEIMALFESTVDWKYSVAWIDCLQKDKNHIGRSILMLGEHAQINELSKQQQKDPLQPPKRPNFKFPITLPNWALNTYSVKLFNYLYHTFSARHEVETIVPYDPYFYPLDHIQDWNKMYGSNGFTQYQCVFPVRTSYDGLNELLHTISSYGQGSFLAVLKRFGYESLPDSLSFPMEGYTLALDFPMNSKTLALMNTLDEIVKKYDGRLYLAKDTRMSANFFNKTYKSIDSFKNYKNNIDKRGYFQSLQSNRLMGT